MYRESFDQESVRRYVEAVRGVLGSDARLRDAASRAALQLPGAGESVAKLSAALPAVGAAPASSGGSPDGPQPYLSRDPMVSLVQSAINGALTDNSSRGGAATGTGLWQRLAFTVKGLFHPGNFSPTDPDWVVKIAESMLGHLAKGNHPFNPRPAEHAISDTARLVVVGDWGTGLPRARAVASHMAEEVSTALEDGREAHVIHLGDVYYSGLPSEYQRHALAYWPVTSGQARAGVTSWSLNGNHDMYSGGFGYFETLLGDPRFAGQYSPDGRATSFFRLTSPSWEFVGLDTAWDANVLSEGAVGVLRDPQADYVNSVAAASGRKLALLSHHQYVSVYDRADIGEELGAKLGPVLRGGRVTAWFWGHEHRCMGFNSTGGVAFPRCLGHGGVPVLQEHEADAAIPSPGAWEYRDYLVSGNQRWARFGFAVLDLAGDRITVRYMSEEGALVRTEEIA
jgi:hypothetical protein